MKKVLWIISIVLLTASCSQKVEDEGENYLVSLAKVEQGVLGPWRRVTEYTGGIGAMHAIYVTYKPNGMADATAYGATYDFTYSIKKDSPYEGYNLIETIAGTERISIITRLSDAFMEVTDPVSKKNIVRRRGFE